MQIKEVNNYYWLSYAFACAWNGSRLVKIGFEIGCTYTYFQYVEYLIFSYKLRHNMYLFTSAILGGKLKIVTVDAMEVLIKYCMN